MIPLIKSKLYHLFGIKECPKKNFLTLSKSYPFGFPSKFKTLYWAHSLYVTDFDWHMHWTGTPEASGRLGAPDCPLEDRRKDP